MKVTGLLFALLFLWLAPSLQACTCGDYEVPLCAEYWGAKFVFVAQVKSISSRGDKYQLPQGAAGGSRIGNEVKVAQLRIEQVLRGEISGDVLSFVGNGADCLVDYKKGKRYLIFATSKDATGLIETSICSGSSRIARDDADYIAKVRSFGSQAAVSIAGRVLDMNERPIPGMKVSVESNGHIQTTVTDEKGLYSLSPVESGLFAVRIQVPFKAFDADYGGESREIVSEPARTILEFTGQTQKGECVYKRFIVVSYATKP